MKRASDRGRVGTRTTVLAVLATVVIAACSGSSDDAGIAGTATTAPAVAVNDATTIASDASEATSTTATTRPPATQPAEDSREPSGTEVPSSEPAVASTVETLPSVGIPGLDSDDLFCAAFSRFGGTWQLARKGAAFIDDPLTVAEFEVAASPVVAEAYSELAENMPDEIASEAETTLDRYFGVFARRSAQAGEALAATGLDAEGVDALAQSWLDALAAADSESTGVPFEAPPEAADALAEAAASFLDAREPINRDPSLNVTAETPLTDAYLANDCPGGSAITGQEVGGG